jgi:exopolysaccharide production protein ExoZ
VKVWSLQVLRFWAALGVVFFHAYISIQQFSGHWGVFGANGSMFGRAGVDVFFVLSGVIITLTSRGLSVREFLGRRASRILPLYLLLTSLYLAAGLFKGTVGWREVVTSLTLWPALDQLVEPAMPVAWTLCFEALFYAAAALVVWRRKLVWPVLAVLATALAIRSGPVLSFIGNPIILEFLLGVGIARLPRWRWALWLIPLSVAAIWVFGASGYPPGIPISGFLRGDLGWSRLLFLGLPAAGIVWGTMQIEVRRGVLTYLGDASYALYLVHLPVVISAAWLLCRYTAAPPDLIAIVAAAASIVMGWRVHEIAEKPMLRWLRERPVMGYATV